MNNPKKHFAVFMYHEVSSVSHSRGGQNHMTPIYNISSSFFAQQLLSIKTNNLLTAFVRDLAEGPAENNDRVFLTFDDGCIGNFTEALPLLLQYGLRATFFVTTSLIGTDNYMNWDQVRELVAKGMSVQSHAINHDHLTNLSRKNLMNELLGSKKIIEDNIQKTVTAFSFPHGSYNQQAVDCAAEAGYTVLCTSDVRYSNFQYNPKTGLPPILLGRIAVATNITLEAFIGLSQGRRKNVYKEWLKKKPKNVLKRLIGIENYGKLYRLYFNIKDD